MYVVSFSIYTMQLYWGKMMIYEIFLLWSSENFCWIWRLHNGDLDQPPKSLELFISSICFNVRTFECTWNAVRSFKANATWQTGAFEGNEKPCNRLSRLLIARGRWERPFRKETFFNRPWHRAIMQLLFVFRQFCIDWESCCFF